MDFFGDVFGTSTSRALFEGLNRVVGDTLSPQDWFAPIQTEEAFVRLPWQASSVEEQGYERQLREAVLLISQSPQIFLQDAPVAAHEVPADIFASAGAVLEADESLRQLRFRLVPKYCSEEQFWNRYFAAVERVKQQVRAEQMWGDFDMLDGDEDKPCGSGAQTSCQVDLPSMRQPGDATDTMSHMVLSGQSSTSAQAVDSAHMPKPLPAAHKSRPVHIRCRQTSKQTSRQQNGADQGSSQRMVMSGDFGSQASSVTEAQLMSPRSMDSTATKLPPSTPSLPSPIAPSPMGPSPIGPFPMGPSPVGPSPLAPSHVDSLPSGCFPEGTYPIGNFPSLSASVSVPITAEAAAAAPALLPADRHALQPAQASPASYHLGPHLLHSDNGKAEVAGLWKDADQSTAPLYLPFKAASLQQLAQAVLDSKKAESMQQVIQQYSKRTSSAAGDRAATVAWGLFDPMHVTAHTQLLSSAHPAWMGGDSLVGNITSAMCEMRSSAEMAMLWTEVMQEIESHWISGRKLPDGVCSPMAGSNHTILHACLATVNAALACRHRGIHSVQDVDVAVTQKGNEALERLQKLPPRQVFEALFRIKADMSLLAATAVAGLAGDNDVLLSGVREAQHLTSTALSQPSLSKSQLTKLCQVFNKLEVMFQVALEQDSLRQQTQQQAAWIASASQQDIRECSPSSSCSADQDPTWSDLGYESWTLL